jgi:hypothetical protein
MWTSEIQFDFGSKLCRAKGEGTQLRGEALLVEPIVYTLDEETLSRYERRVFVQ